MPRNLGVETDSRTQLAAWRIRRGVTQAELARAIGISPVTYRRIERGTQDNPPIRYLANAALALGVKLEELIEPEYREWKTFDARQPQPPAHKGFWRYRA